MRRLRPAGGTARCVPALVAALASAGCGPSLTGLLDEGHYREAICAAANDDDPEVRDRVRAELGAQVDPAVHVRAVTPEELRVAFGAEAAAALAGFVVLRVRHDSNPAPLDGVRAYVWLEADGEQAAALFPSRERVAELAGETIPAPYVEDRTNETLDAVVAGAAAAVFVPGVLIDGATFGLFRITDGLVGALHGAGDRDLVTIHPTEDEIARAAPVAVRLSAALQSDSGDCGQPGATCTSLTALVRPASESAELVLGLGVAFEATRRSAAGMEAWPCGVHDSVRLRLPAGASLEQRINALFGDAMQRLRTLEASSASSSTTADGP